MSSGLRRQTTRFPQTTRHPHWRITACMLRIPYLCSPHPDEMFGSLLPRVRLHNNEAVWKAIWGRSGKDQPSNSIPFDVPKLTDELAVLLEYLEIPYDNVLRRLTTLPYWLNLGSLIGIGLISCQTSFFVPVTSARSKLPATCAAFPLPAGSTVSYRFHHSPVDAGKISAPSRKHRSCQPHI